MKLMQLMTLTWLKQNQFVKLKQLTNLKQPDVAEVTDEVEADEAEAACETGIAVSSPVVAAAVCTTVCCMQ